MSKVYAITQMLRAKIIQAELTKFANEILKDKDGYRVQCDEIARLKNMWWFYQTQYSIDYVEYSKAHAAERPLKISSSNLNG